MAFNVNTFRSKLKLDGARPNLFEFSMATGRVGIPEINEDLTFMCRVAQLPEDNIGVIPVTYFGREIKIAGNRTFPELTVTIINDEDFKIRNAMEDWMNGLNQHVQNNRFSTYRSNPDYTCDGLVTQYGKSGPSNQIKKYKFVGCWPTNVSAIDLDWGANDQIEEYQVTFAYQWWESDTTDSTGSGATTVNVDNSGRAVGGGP